MIKKIIGGSSCYPINPPEVKYDAIIIGAGGRIFANKKISSSIEVGEYNGLVRYLVTKGNKKDDIDRVINMFSMNSETSPCLLDIGCGCGAIDLELARNGDKPLNVVGVDIDERNCLRDNWKRLQKPDNIVFLVAEAGVFLRCLPPKSIFYALAARPSHNVRDYIIADLLTNEMLSSVFSAQREVILLSLEGMRSWFSDERFECVKIGNKIFGLDLSETGLWIGFGQSWYCLKRRVSDESNSTNSWVKRLLKFLEEILMG